ncbi:MAG: alpha/beta hydrolase [Eubacteriales bacterium]|nr:alpha/beta hydrolase [Eubacteriales bacterium]
MSRILLIHGAWHNEKCWNTVISLLEKEGYDAFALTLPGNEVDGDKNVSYDDYVNHVVEVINNQPDDVIVVGHSSAGHVIQMAVPKVKDKVKKIIFNDAWIIPDGQSQFDLVPEEIKNGMIEAAKASGENAIPVDPGFLRGMLATEADEETFEKLLGILVSQPLALMETPINAKPLESLNMPKVLLYCTKDISLPKEVYVGMFVALGSDQIVEVECDHEGLFTNPEAFTKGLIKCIEI